MGVAVSTQSPLAPVSLASSVVGFAGFAFTVATAIGVFWSNLQTFAAAPTEIHDSLSNLRQSLYEERAHLRKARRHGRRRRSSASARAGKGATGVKEKENDVGPDAALQAMVTAVKHMITKFKLLERPFLKDQSSRSKRRQKDGWADDTYGQGYSSSLGEDEASDYLYAENRYKECGFRERLIWLKSKNNAVSLLEALNRLEVRRIGMQITEISTWMRELHRNLDDVDERLDAVDRLEHRLSRVVGVRRVD